MLRGVSLVAAQMGKEAVPELRRAVLVAQQGLAVPLRAAAPPQPERARSHETRAAPAARAASADVAAPPSVPERRPPAGAPPLAEPLVIATPAAAVDGGGSAPRANAAPAPDEPPAPADWAAEPPSAPELREEAVPASSLGRAFHFGMLGASVLTSGFGELARRRMASVLGGESAAGGAPESARTAFVNERSAEQMARTLTKLRGAALKLGQLLSLQDEGAMPKHLQAIFAKVRASANIMPAAQLHTTISSELGTDWRERVRSFQETPLAAASIGQVHRVVLRDGRLAALKVQYPGVAASVDSDLANLRRLAHYTGALPKTLFVDNIIKVARDELLAECDYVAEAASTERYGELLRCAMAADPARLGGKFATPAVVRELSSARVLTTELMLGEPIEAVARMSVGRRNAVASRVLNLTMRELFEWRFVQTDPNWGNFLYDAKRDLVSMLDFGAARAYPKPFVDNYMRMVDACTRRDRAACIDASIALGFLTGEESVEMLDAHVAAGFVLGEPFGAAGPYDFAAAQISARVREHVPTMMKLRLCPPPDEVYSLHRKLSGAYMLCIRLGATIDCREVFEEIRDGYDFSPAAAVAGADGGAGAAKLAAGARGRDEPALV